MKDLHNKYNPLIVTLLPQLSVEGFLELTWTEAAFVTWFADHVGNEDPKNMFCSRRSI